jgi:hypothetical protein
VGVVSYPEDRVRDLLSSIIIAAALIAAGCGETVTADQRVTRCLSKQPDASKAECSKWEKDGELQDNGTHEDHENM